MGSRDDKRRPEEQAEAYEPPEVEDLPAQDGPVVTAAGKQTDDGTTLAAEWRP
jgi:hypothetical protein